MRILLLAALIVAFHAWIPAAEPIPAEISAGLEKLSARWEQARKDLDLPALGVAVVHDDSTVFAAGYGTIAPGGVEKVTPASPFYIASSTKPFTAMGIAILAAEGKVDLDAPVKTYLPAFRLRDPALTEKISLRDLLCHRYGIDSNPISFREAYSGQIDDVKFFELLERANIPGKFTYSNLHFTISGRVIQAVTGRPWQDFLQERIFVPAGMKHTTARASRLFGELHGVVPSAYAPSGRIARSERKTDRTMHAAGGIGSSAEDLARWIRLNMNGGAIEGTQIVSRKLAKEMLTPQEKAEEPDGRFTRESIGLAWMLGKYRDEPAVFHHGGYSGARSHISFLSDRKWGVVALTNDSTIACTLVDLIAGDVYDLVLGKQDEDPLPALIEKSRQSRLRLMARPEFIPDTVHASNLGHPIANYAGRYEDRIWGVLSIQADKEALKAEFGDFPLGLKCAGIDQFGTEFRGKLETLRFTVSPEGKVTEATLAPAVGTIRRFVRIP